MPTPLFATHDEPDPPDAVTQAELVVARYVHRQEAGCCRCRACARLRQAWREWEHDGDTDAAPLVNGGSHA